MPWRFLGWLFGRLLALALLSGAAWVVYDSASSSRFAVRSVRVEGHALLRAEDVESVASVLGANLFWIDSRAVERRLNLLPMVLRSEVTTVLPDTVRISVVERRPSAFWVSGGQTYLVDRDGTVLKPVDPSDTAPACDGQRCDPSVATTLPVVAQVDGGPLAAGARVEARSLTASGQLAHLLPPMGVQPLAFEWSRDRGLEILTQQGWRVRFDPSGDVTWQLNALQAIRDELARTKRTAEIVDVRFGDRPYVR